MRYNVFDISTRKNRLHIVLVVHFIRLSPPNMIIIIRRTFLLSFHLPPSTFIVFLFLFWEVIGILMEDFGIRKKLVIYQRRMRRKKETKNDNA